MPEPESEDPKEPEKVTNNDLRNSQFGGGFINADIVNAQRIGGDIWNIRNLFLGQRDSTQSLNPRNRVQQILLKQVSTEVESRLNQSLHNRIYIVQDTDQNSEQIELPWASEIKVGSKPKVHLTNTEITTVYDQPDIAGRLLILGEPGVGKTTMLLKLAEKLLDRTKTDSEDPIPVLFSLSSWKDEKQSIKEWLVDQLKDKYGVRKDIGKGLLNNQEIIPLLDGLDELAAERQEKCVIKINDFLHAGWSNPLAGLKQKKKEKQSIMLY
jgi:predicted NACHT family NTPase